jgi:hypothetical protein
MLAACGPAPPSPEHQVLTSFFRASRVRDTTMLAAVAAAVFEPRIDGVVQQFEITDFGSEQSGAAIIQKRITIDARVRTPDGRVVAKALAVTMQRAPGERRWFVTGITPLQASRTSPAASSAPLN